MKTQKIKRYRLVVSRTFPMTHTLGGLNTCFVELIQRGIKIHTIRSNYELWAKRISEVQEGRAVIELFYWDGKPYKSKQIVFATLDKYSGCGVQELRWLTSCTTQIRDNGKLITDIQLAKNDGLSIEEFKAWFKDYDLSKQMAIIHFTKFRY